MLGFLMIRSRIQSALLRVLATLPFLLLTDPGLAVAAGTPTATSSTLPYCEPALAFDPSRFANPTHIDNRFLPLTPGTQFTLDGVANSGGGPTSHRVVLTVTDLTKSVDGVTSLVLWDRDYDDGALAESELTFFAQDDDGNVWNTGEYPEEYDVETGEFLGAPSTWISGEAGSLAGLQMLAAPRVGTPAYLQGQSRRIGFWDCAQVYQTGQVVSVPAGRYGDVLVNDEWDPLDQEGGIQRKLYAPGVGAVEVTAVGDPEGETLHLTRVAHLSPKAMQQVRGQVLAMDARAYEVSQVYRNTSPAR